MKKFFVSTAIAVACFSFTSCQDNDKDKSKKESKTEMKDSVKVPAPANTGKTAYSISAPDGWVKKDTTISGARLTTITSPLENAGDDFMENVNVATEPAQGYDYKGYAIANRNSMKSQMSDMNFLSEEELKIGDMPAMAIVYAFKYGNYNLKNTAYFVVKNDVGYVITCTAVNTKFQKYQPQFKTCVNSFRVND